MKTYRVDFKPVSPYFFGNEKTFPYHGQQIGQSLSNAYYIKSEYVPTQTTVLGALRYLFLAHRKNDYVYTEREFAENAKRVGAETFDISKKEVQDFGVIEQISSVFLYHGEKGILIPTPFDHNEKSFSSKYQPFANYAVAETSDGEKLYTSDYDPKCGLTSSYMMLNTQEIIPSCDIFSDEDRIGIAIDKTENAYFKKKYAMLKKDYSFSVYLTLSDETVLDTLQKSAGGSVSVFMGQGKSAFLVSFTEEADTLQTKISAMLKRNLPVTGEILYFMGDSVLSSSRALYEKTVFSVVKTKNYRAFGIAYQDSEKGKLGRFQKKETLYQLISAGSIVITSDTDGVLALFENPNAKKIGLNQIIK